MTCGPMRGCLGAGQTALAESLPDNYYDCIVEATGQSAGFEQALRLIRPQGTLILKSTFSATEPVNLSSLVVKEVNLMGSRCGPFRDALDLLKNKSIDVNSLIDGIYPLSEGVAAFQQALKPGMRKILLRPHLSG